MRPPAGKHIDMSNTTYADQVYEHILGRLLRRELRPGDVLDRRKIAGELDVSLIPVSDAVQKLTYEGFLTTRRRHGTFVSTPDLEDIRGQLLLREALECQAARLYCGAPVQQAQRELSSLAKAADKAASKGRQVWSEDFDFHQALVELTGCAAIIECFQRVVNLSMFHETARISPMHQSTYDNHVTLLRDLCKTTTPDAAEARIRAHVRTGKEAFYGAPR